MNIFCLTFRPSSILANNHKEKKKRKEKTLLKEKIFPKKLKTGSNRKNKTVTVSKSRYKKMKFYNF